MIDEPKDVPDSVREIVSAMIRQALARCDRLGIAWEDFHRAMREEQEQAGPLGDVAALIERTFRRLGSQAN